MVYMVLGSGMMGSAVALDLLESTEDRVLLADRDAGALGRCSEQISDNRLSAMQLDVKDDGLLRKTMAGVDVVINALPHSFDLSMAVTEAALSLGKDVVDLDPSGWEERLAWDARAKEAGVQVLVGCGVAPGLSNIFMGYAASKMDQVESGVIRCGGLPQDHPVPPLDYRIVFNFEGTLSLYLNAPWVIEDGEIRKIDNMSGLEILEYSEPLGTLECFNTDGLTTLLHTMKAKGIKRLYEKTIRYPGHYDKMKLFIEAGLLGEDPVEGCVPRRLLSTLLEPKLKMEPGHRDFTILHVEAHGLSGSRELQVDLFLLDLYDGDKHLTSMAKTTCYPASIAAQMLAAGAIPQKGVTPLEEVFTGKCFESLMKGLARRGISVTETAKFRSVV